MKLTACVITSNSEYWIGYIVRELAEWFPTIVFDVCSLDNTREIARSVPNVEVVEHLSLDASEISTLKTGIFDLVDTSILLLEGTIYVPRDVCAALAGVKFPKSKSVGFLLQKQLVYTRNGLGLSKPYDLECVYSRRVVWAGEFPYFLHDASDVKSARYYFDKDLVAYNCEALETSPRDPSGEYEVTGSVEGYVDLEEIIPGPHDFHNPYVR